MIGGILDKLVFAGVLLGLFQLPILTEHYHQYLTGYFTAVEKEVQHLKQLASKHNYSNASAMLKAHATSDLPSVIEDASHKQELLVEYQELAEAIEIFERPSLAPKLQYMLNPSRSDRMESVLKNFEPGIPLSPSYLLGSALAALLFNILGSAPAALIRRAKKRKKSLA